jgi:hypothetical protein
VDMEETGISPVSASEPSKTTVVRIKPMKEVSLKEAALWCHLKGIPTMNSRGWEDAGMIGEHTKKDARGKGMMSLEMLTERKLRLGCPGPG